jgi:hypothetical protein
MNHALFENSPTGARVCSIGLLSLLTATPSADADLGYYRTFEQRVIVDAIKVHLASDADAETSRRKRLTQHAIAS